MRSALVALACLVVTAVTAKAAEVIYTDTHGQHCRQITENSELSQYTCKGIAGRTIAVSDAVMIGNLHYGAADESLQPSTRITGEGIGKKVEWRLADGRPYAAIHRVLTPGGSVLVVTRLDRVKACHAGYVDGRSPDANGVAAGLAETARVSFRCGIDKPTTVGRKLYGMAS